MRYILGIMAFLALFVGCTPPEVTGRALYADYCANCHGRGGAGDGPMAAGLEVAPADLTQIAARNGGVFPTVEVISTIDGYTRRVQHDTIMPEFGIALQAGELVMLDTGGGVRTPTPERLVALAAYLETLQQP